MMLLSGMWQGVPTFQMIPVTEDCPYLEVVFMPRDRVLAVISKVKEERLQMVARLDTKGYQIPIKGQKDDKGNQAYEAQRITINTYHDYYVLTPPEIEQFIETFAINADKYPFRQLLEMAFKQPQVAPKMSTEDSTLKADVVSETKEENTVDFAQAKKELDETPADNTSA